MITSGAKIPPHKIVLCIAYPYEKTDFQRCFQTGKSDFIASLNLSNLSMEEAWLQYDIDATSIRQCIDELKSRNVDVIPLYDVNDLSAAVGYDVVIILAEHNEDDDTILLLNSPVQASILATSFLWIKDCIIDITTCFSMTFRQLQGFFFPTCRILNVEAPLSSVLYLHLVREIVKRLAHDYSRGYAETSLDCYMDFFNMQEKDVHRQEYKCKTYYTNDLAALENVYLYIVEKEGVLRQDLMLEIKKTVLEFCIRNLDSNNDFDAMRVFCMYFLEMQNDDTMRQDLMHKIKDTVISHCVNNPDTAQAFCMSILKMQKYDVLRQDGMPYKVYRNYQQSKLSREELDNLLDNLRESLLKAKESPSTSFPPDIPVSPCISRKEERENYDVWSTVFAPLQVSPGNSFMVQLFIHRQEDSSDVEIMASTIDLDSGMRNCKRLSFPLESGDTIKVRLEAVFDKRNEFEIDESDKEIVWNDEPVSVEFVVSVNETCISKAFFGRFRIRVNSLSVCDIRFKVLVFEGADHIAPYGPGIASFELIPYDRMKEAKEAADLMKKRISDNILNLESGISSHSAPSEVDRANKELAINRHCLELIENDSRKKSPVRVVFISSTSDLKESRETVRKAIEKSHMYPEMYENWPQGNVYPRDKCIKKVLSSDIFICILGANYGRVEHMWDMSMTEIEYRAALLSGKNILVYIDRQYESKMASLGNEEHKERQLDLIKELSDKRWVKYFDDQASLEREVQGDLSEMIKDMENGFLPSVLHISSQEHRIKGFNPWA